ncbi:RluA family pseudouridine synthase [Streptococcus macacae]|uniref:Pseudouridine synthase n=1 Tax=Streptococcus macacae NCTC 11558 TaxID=764298 RepID=G5JV15_9STRE|nr:RluA family pseudouridine synthase [Streptococcus macacae]EHJ53284.1 pseudouridine synthase, RluA family [Streptococcus macacae NCTC 11558]SUN79317.1 pseudouridylate synthase [Streptococcus macacae NCTC 11558]
MTFTVKIQNPYSAETVKELLEDYLLIPRKIRHFLRIKKNITINGETINWQTPIKKGDLVELTFEDDDYPQKDISLGNQKYVDCLYEDEHLIIVNKAEGMKTHANQPNEIALLNHVSAYAGTTCYVVHRLDKETSGAVVFAKNPFILPILNRMLEKKQIKREYWALVQGCFLKTRCTYTDKIGRDRHDPRKRIVNSQYGKKAITQVTLLQHYANSSLIKCHLQTGRTHQIRVHLAHHKHAIIGDPLYGQKISPRLMLHAYQLSFTHPLTLEKIKVTASSKTFKQGIPDK